MNKMPYSKTKIITYIFFLFFSLFGCFLFHPSSTWAFSLNYPDLSRPLEICEGWQYKLGDSPIDESGIPIWSLDYASDKNWNNFNHSAKPIESRGYGNIWIRVKLPNVSLEDPFLYVKSLNQAFEVYFEGKKIYEYFNAKSPGKREILGYSNHIISLNTDYQGKYIYFRIFSYDANVIGLFRDFSLGSQADIIKFIFQKDLTQTVISFIFIFIGFILIALFITKFLKESSLLSLAFFSICIGIWSFTRTDIKLFFFNNPPVWYYIDVISLYLIPVGFCAFVPQTFKVKQEFILKYLWQFFILNVLLTLVLDITNIVPLYLTLGPFYILLYITMSILIYSVAGIALKGEINAIFFTVGLTVLCVSATYDILGEYLRIIHWHTYMTPRGMLVFMISLVFILSRRVLEVHNKLISYSNEIETKNEALSHMFLEIKSSKEKIAKWSESLEQTVLEKTAAVRNLLDNAGQGFLIFGTDMIVRSEYSKECIKIFEKRIDDCNFAELVFSEDHEQMLFMADITQKILLEDDTSKRDVLLTLIPDEAFINNKDIHMEYKIIKDENKENSQAFMVILTDITEKRHLEKQMEQERRNLKMVVKVIVYYNDFIECIKDFKNFYNKKIYILIDSESSLDEKIFEIFRYIHTFKGSFSQLNMLNTADHLNELESEISNFCKNIKNITSDEVNAFIKGLNMQEWLEKDLLILKNILGEQFYKMENTLNIDKSRLIEIENKVKTTLPPFECRILLPYIRALRYIPFKELVKSYPDYVMRLSDQVEKLVNPLIIEGGDFPVDADIYYSFARSLSHVFRNIIDHGIEPLEERLSRGKEEYGNIKCTIHVLDGKISLVISDDGNGIDMDKVRNKALETGLIDMKSSTSLSHEEILKFIFKEGFTTREYATEISGRGIGLYSIKSEVESMGGSIKIKTKAGEGTEFHFLLPYEELFESHDKPVTTYIEPIVETTKRLFNEQTGLTLESINENTVEKVESVLLKDVTAFINIKGVLQGTFVMSSDENLIKAIIKKFINYNSIMYNIPEDESSFVDEEVLSEFFNMALGNSLKMFVESEDLIMIDTPATVNSKGNNSLLKYPGSEIWTYNLGCSEGAISITFMTSGN